MLEFPSWRELEEVAEEVPRFEEEGWRRKREVDSGVRSSHRRKEKGREVWEHKNSPWSSSGSPQTGRKPSFWAPKIQRPQSVYAFWILRGRGSVWIFWILRDLLMNGDVWMSGDVWIYGVFH